MASQTLRHHFKDYSATTTTTPTSSTTTNPFATSTAKTRRQKKMAMAKRALRSLAVALMVPLSLTMTMIFLFGSGHKYRALAKPFWFPNLWLIHLGSLGSSFLMGLSAWLVWAEGGFHSQSEALPLYIAHVFLSIVFDPLVLKVGAAHLGLVFCVINFGTLVACYRKFQKINPIAGDLVKPCLAWMAFISLVNFKLIFLKN